MEAPPCQNVYWHAVSHPISREKAPRYQATKHKLNVWRHGPSSQEVIHDDDNVAQKSACFFWCQVEVFTNLQNPKRFAMFWTHCKNISHTWQREIKPPVPTWLGIRGYKWSALLDDTTIPPPCMKSDTITHVLITKNTLLSNYSMTGSNRCFRTCSAAARSRAL